MYICKPYIIYCDFENKHILIFILNNNNFERHDINSCYIITIINFMSFKILLILDFEINLIEHTF